MIREIQNCPFVSILSHVALEITYEELNITVLAAKHQELGGSIHVRGHTTSLCLSFPSASWKGVAMLINPNRGP